MNILTIKIANFLVWIWLKDYKVVIHKMDNKKKVNTLVKQLVHLVLVLIKSFMKWKYSMILKEKDMKKKRLRKVFY